MTVFFVYSTKNVTEGGFWNNTQSVIENMKSKFHFQSGNLATSPYGTQLYKIWKLQNAPNISEVIFSIF